MKKLRFTVKFNRRRKGITNYKKRLKMLLANKPRLVIRKSLNNTSAQITTYEAKGDRIEVSADSKELKKYGWNSSTGNLPSAYLTGLLLGQRANKKGIKEVVLDFGLNVPTKGGRIFAALKGVIDSGITVPHSEEVLPSDDRINGAHIVNYSNSIKADKERYDKQFASYTKKGIDPAKLVEYFDTTKKKITEI